MLLTLDPRSELPLYRQIASAIRRSLREGDISAGDRLPATRDLATSLGVNMHTVLRSYAMLRDEGLVELRRGRGAIVREGSNEAAAVRHLVVELAVAAQHQGMDASEVIEMLKKEFS